jgi:type I restriction enzyme S subunit
MSNDWFFEKFALIADAPGAVDRIRELVLDLAVQGKLVEQSSNDETTDLLLKRLSGSDVSSFDPTTYHPSDAPLNMLPINWRWAPTSLLCDLQTGKRMKGGAQETGVISLGGEHLKPDGSIDYSVPRYVSTAFYNDMKKGKVRAHDTLMVKDGATTGKTAFVSYLPSDGLAAVNEHVFILRWHEPIEKKLAFYFMRAFAIGHIATKSAGLIGGIRREAVLDFPFPLPPLAEQKRIVAKVDELMGLCDELEGQQQERELRKSVLVRSSLSRFAESPTRENLGYLFHNSYDIPPSELRKSILTLAVQGLLVAHDSESAVWETRKLKDLTTKIGSGSTPSGGKESYQASGVPLIRSMNVHFGGFVRQGLAFLNDEQAEKLKNVAVKADDVLLNITGASIGRVATAPRNMEGARVNQHVCIVRPTSAITPQFLELFLASPVVQNLIDAVQVGATREALTKTMIEQFEIPVPSVGEQRRIVAKVDQLMALVDELERQQEASREKASKLLDAIVQEMTSGGRDIAATLES